MKKQNDPRHQKRQKIINELFAHSFIQQENRLADKTQKILGEQAKIDRLIAQAAPQWPIGKIAKIDLAILRLAVFELTVEREQPPKVIIDEAIELAKEFGGTNSPAFINGVLGALLKTRNKTS